jgi:hypothetical protein
MLVSGEAKAKMFTGLWPVDFRADSEHQPLHPLLHTPL